MTKSNNRKLSVGLSFSSEAGLGLPIVSTGTTSYTGKRYLPYSSDSKRYNTANLYPQQIAKLANDSPTNSASINKKAMLVTGFGFETEGINRNFLTMLKNINEDGETADDILAKIALDYVTFDGYALKVTWGNDGFLKYVEHIPFAWVRCGEPNERMKIDYYVVNNNWDKTLPPRQERVYTIPAFNPSYFGKNSVEVVDYVPTPSEEQSLNAEQLIYVKRQGVISNNGMQFYPVPSYVGALDSIQAEIDIIIANKSLINNGVGGKTIVAIPLNLQEEEKSQFMAELTARFTNAENNGAVIPIFGEDKEALPTITNIEALDASTYLNNANEARQYIMSCHNVDPILLGINTGGGFNNRAEEMESAFQLMNKTIIRQYQQDIERMFNTLSIHFDWPTDFKIKRFTLVEPTITVEKSVNTDKASLDVTATNA